MTSTNYFAGHPPDVLEQSMTVMMRRDASSVIYKVIGQD